jgi:hypothetical protein
MARGEAGEFGPVDTEQDQLWAEAPWPNNDHHHPCAIL